jgi:spermidine synthase
MDNHVKPVVYESLSSKSLFFSMQDVQSKMDLLQPDALQFEYTRIMMGFLLHQAQPRSIAMLGLGGGSLAKFCYRHLPDADITVVEINPHVIAHRSDFLIPTDDHRFRVVLGDAADFVQQSGRAFDIILADGYDMHGLPERLSTLEFYGHCYQLLQPGGVFVANLHGCNPHCEVYIDRIRSEFKGCLLVVNDPGGSNRVALSIKAEVHALQSLAGVRRPCGFDANAWKDLAPSLARVFLASRALSRRESNVKEDLSV